MKARWTNIDLMECLGILFVILYHSTTYNFNFMETSNVLLYLRYYFRTILSTCVPLFFFANGYLLLNQELNLKKHIKKCLRIIILTFVWGMIGLIAIMLIEGKIFSVRELIRNLWNWQPIGWINHLWYMGALICIYIFLPLIKHVYDTKRSYFYFFLIMVAIYTFGNKLITYSSSIIIDLFNIKNIVTKENVFNMFNPFRGVYGYAFVYFCIGGIMYNFKEKIIHIKRKNVSAILAIILNCLLLFGLGLYFSKATNSKWDVVWNGYDTIFTFINVIGIYVISLSYTQNNPLIKNISCNTLGIFFIHNIFIHMTKKYIMEIPIFCTLIGNIIYAFGLILICLFMAKMIQKVPFINRLLKI